VRLIKDGDIAGAITAGRGILGVDLLYGVGGTPEGVTAACALTALGGAIQGRLWPRNDEERRQAIDAGYDLTRVLTLRDLVNSDDIFFAATGVTDGVLLQGVRQTKNCVYTQSLVMRSRSGTIRTINAEHNLSKLKEIGAEEPWRRH
jgi:fructose-1,6-bisphosphatase II